MNSLISEEKKALVIEMLKLNANNNKIQEESKLRFKTGIHPEALSQIRKDLGIPSPGITANKAKTTKVSEGVEPTRSQIAQQKKEVALQLLKQGASNKEVQAEILARFGTNIPMVNITDLRSLHKIPGQKGKRKSSATKPVTKSTKSMTSTQPKFPKKKENARTNKAQQKQEMALVLLQQGASNKEVQSAVKAKFGNGIPMINITKLRSQYKIPGHKGKRKSAFTKNKTASVTTPKTDPTTKKSADARTSKAQQKQEMALVLLQQGASNKEVQSAVKAKFGNGIPMINITKLRSQYKIPGKKGKRSVSAKKGTSFSSNNFTPESSLVNEKITKVVSPGNSFLVTWESKTSIQEKSFENESQVKKFIQELIQQGVSPGSIEGWRKLEKQIQFQFVF